MEQYKLDFGSPEEKKNEKAGVETEPVKIYSFDELVADYKKTVGVDPTHRMLNRGEIIRGIQDPEAEKARLKAEDDEDDRAERSSGRAGR